MQHVAGLLDDFLRRIIFFLLNVLDEAAQTTQKQL